MPIPDFQSLMLPLLEFAGDQKEHLASEVKEYIYLKFSLSEDEKRELLPSGTQTVIDNRIGWAKTYLKKAGLVEYIKKGYFKITSRGLEILEKNPPAINIKYLTQFPEFIEFRTLKDEKSLQEREEDQYNKRTPQELLEIGYENIKRDITQELLDSVKNCSPKFFEDLVIELILKMGYGGSRTDAGRTIGKTADGGIDGIIKEDKLGLDFIGIQAKRWADTTVGSPEIHKFVGALQQKKAKKGIFITTSSFSKSAREAAKNLETKIILIDGEELAQYMFNYDIGISTTKTFKIKKIDSDYFSEE